MCAGRASGWNIVPYQVGYDPAAQNKTLTTQARLGYNNGVGSLKFGGVLFIAFANDHPPRHVHGFAGETEAIIDLRSDGGVVLSKRRDGGQPGNEVGRGHV